MDLRGARIGYAPHTADLTGPVDRRRFCFYARKRGLEFEIADPAKTYDLLVVTGGSDLSRWLRYPTSRTRVVFELVDSYLAVPRNDWKNRLRGLAKFAVRQSRYLWLDYQEGLRAMCRRAHAVVCTTVEQRTDILPYCSNVHIVLDFHTAESTTVKAGYRCSEPFRLVWEGLAANLLTFTAIREVLEDCGREKSLTVHLVTDLEFGMYLAGKFGRRRTAPYARQFLAGPFELHPWTQPSFAGIVTSCDLGVIPIPSQDPLYRGKPENKLLLLWRLGMPVVVSATPAYVRATQAAGLPDMACSGAEEWKRVLRKYMNDEDARREAGQRGREYAEREFGEEVLAGRWDAVLDSAFSGQAPVERDAGKIQCVD